ncbi:MAG: hypothetical protein F4112_12260 [Holophagales bacterium]|nr:hypothetical protein [Holophagales bacterium]MYD20832.1 hypothetical protein [Holophagales bacterium]MYI33725.1 hypothetical protein [Holophagales bacterium]
MSAVTVGSVPLTLRVDASNVIPGGRPDTLYLYGGTPPVAAGNVVFSEPPEGSRESGIAGSDKGGGGGGAAGAATTAVNVTESVALLLSLTEYVTV